MSRRSTIAVALLLAGGSAGYLLAPARHAEAAGPAAPPACRVGYVCLSELMRRYDRWQVESKTMTARRNQFAAEVNGKRAEMTRAQAALPTAPPAEKPAIEQKMIVLKREIEDAERAAKADLDGDSAKVLRALFAAIQEELAGVVAERKLTAVMGYPGSPATAARQGLGEVPANMIDMILRPPAANVLFVDPACDLTDELVKRLNARGA